MRGRPKSHSKTFVRFIIWAGLTFIFILGSLSIVFAAETASSKAWVSASTLNLRSAPSIETEVVDRLEFGTLVDVVEQDYSWSRIRSQKTEGWVHSSYLKHTYYAWVNPEDVALYEGQSMSSRRIYSLERDDRLFVTKEEGDWAYAETEGAAGWIYRSFLRRGPESGWVDTPRSRVFSRPVYNAQPLLQLHIGEEVIILQELRNWTEIRTGDTEGWIKTGNLSRHPVAQSAENSRADMMAAYFQSQPDLPRSVKSAIQSGEILIGMDAEQVVATLGYPEVKVRNTPDSEQWQYFSEPWLRYINFYRDYVTSLGREPSQKNNYSDSGTRDIH